MKNYKITVNGVVYEVSVEEVTNKPGNVKKTEINKSIKEDFSSFRSPLPGKVLEINVNKGDIVKKGDLLMLLEAMKMENEIVSTFDGVIREINVIKGNTVESGDEILTYIIRNEG
jgi:biotin carboxyl carrier protein